MSLLVRLLLIVAFLSFSVSGAIAKTPDEECGHAEAAGLSCTACGDCAVITTKVGEKLYKLCNEYDCNLASADECSECD